MKSLSPNGGSEHASAPRTPDTARTELEGAITSLAGVRILVVGDLILDHYTLGRPMRISREAPIAVLEYEREYVVPGGGSSPACTIAALGGHAELAGVVGEDSAASALLDALQFQGVDVKGVIADSARPTIQKKRIVALVTPSMRQQVARVDRIDRSAIRGEVEDALMGEIARRLPLCDAALLSNYKSGTLTPRVVAHTRELAVASGKVLTVDSQGDLPMFAGFGIVKCNQAEAEAALQRPLSTDLDFERGMASLLSELAVGTVMVTRGAEGMSVMTADGAYCHIPVANTSEVFDVTGAGDTVMAIVTLAVAAGVDVFTAARLANFGAGIVVRKWGNAVPRLDELLSAVREA